MPKYLLETIYYSLFNSHIIYASQIWGQSKSDHCRKLVELQDKVLRICNFLPDTAPLRRYIEKFKNTETSCLYSLTKHISKTLTINIINMQPVPLHTQFYFCP